VHITGLKPAALPIVVRHEALPECDSGNLRCGVRADREFRGVRYVGVQHDVLELRTSIITELQNSFLRQVTHMWKEEPVFILCSFFPGWGDVIYSVKNVVLSWYGCW
jgi:hypothetical protein